ncbi:MAG: FHA domain-containing protein [Anaerolineales bacterium]
MKPIKSFILAIILSFIFVLTANAQAAETIWLTSNYLNPKTGETVVVTVNAISATPIQGFNFQIRYDPTCVQPVNASSSIAGMNGLSLPQTPGLVDASFASTTPQTANGVLAEVQFYTLRGCQTNLTLEAASLAIRNESGFAAPLTSVTIGEKTLAVNIDSAVGSSEAQALLGTPLPLGTAPVTPPSSKLPSWIIVLLTSLIGAVLLFILYRLLRQPSGSNSKKSNSARAAVLQIKRGPFAGKNFTLTKLPFRIGRDPNNELCLNDPNLNAQHAQIIAANNSYYLLDLGGDTFVNEKPINKNSTILKSGDTVRLGQNVLFVFGS